MKGLSLSDFFTSPKSKAQKRIEQLLRKALLEDGEMAYALYEYELLEHIDYWYAGLKRDKNDFVFVVTEHSGDTAMLLIMPSKEIYINELAREKLVQLWKNAYQENIEQLLPAMAQELSEDILAVNGVTIVPTL